MPRSQQVIKRQKEYREENYEKHKVMSALYGKKYRYYKNCEDSIWRAFRKMFS